MSYKNSIENKLKELEAGKFQRLCNELLESMGYGKVTNSGGQTGTDKTILGTPDSYIHDVKGKFTFIEYTTQQSNVCQKFKADIDKCFDETKTGVKTNQIEKIIIAYNSKMSVGDISTLSDLCTKRGVSFEKLDIDNIAHLLSSKYPFITKDYLALPIEKGQFLDLNNFIRINDKSVMSTPLGLSFHGRDEKLIEFQDLVDDNQFLIVSGKTGLGKTKFVCEVLKKFEFIGEYENTWFIKDRGLGMYEELLRYTSTGKHLIFLDDINKLTAIEELLSYFGDNQDRIKIVATVRDYALESTVSRICKYVTPCVFELDALDDDSIVEVIKDNFGINNSDYHRQITKLAKGNIRLAVMMAIIAKKENTLQSIQSIGAILESYYEFVQEKLDDIDDESYLKALGALSFYEKLHIKSDKAMVLVKQITSIDENDLDNIYRQLHYDEMIDIYEDEVVVISDQIVSVFIFHYVFEIRKLLDYAEVLRLLFPTHKNRIIQNINAVLAYYGNIDYFTDAVNTLWKSWKSIGDENFRELVLTFWFVNPEETLMYISNEISMKPQNHELLDDYIVDNKTDYELMLSTLGQFSNDSNIHSAFEIALNYLERDKTKIKEVSKMLIECYGYDLHSYKQNYQIQKVLLDTVITRMTNGNEVMVQLFCNVASYLLSYCVEWTESPDHRSVTIHWIELYNSGKMNDIRNCIWIKCNELLLDGRFSDYVMKILTNYGQNRRGTQDKTLYEFDFNLIREYIIPALDLDLLENCALIHNLEKRYKRMISMSFPELKVLKLDSYVVYKVFMSNPYDFDEDWKVGKQKLDEYQVSFAKSISPSEYMQIMCICKEISKLEDDKYTCRQVMALIISHAVSNVDMIEQYIIADTPFDIQPINFLQKLIEEVGFINLRALILKFDFRMKEYWEYILYSLVAPDNVNQELYNDLMKYFEQTDKLCIGYYRDLKFLVNYKSYDKDIVCTITQIIFEKPDELLRRVYLYRFFSDEEETKELFEEFGDNHTLLENIYIYLLERNEVYDPNGIVCRLFLSKNKHLIYRLIDYLCGETHSLHGYRELFDYSVFWGNDVDKIIELFEYVITEHIQYSFESTLEQFFMGSELKDYSDKRDEVISKMIAKSSDKKETMRILFHIIANFDDETRIRFYLEFLTVNLNLEDFERLPISKSSESWSGSEVPRLLTRQAFVQKLLEHISGVAYLGHRSYLKAVVKSYDDSINRARVREFLSDY